jgi:hypothetical protein
MRTPARRSSYGSDFDDARARRAARHEAQFPLHPLGERAAVDRRRRDGTPRSSRRAADRAIIVAVGGGSVPRACIVMKTSTRQSA